MRPCPKKRAALPMGAGKTMAMLVRAIWQIVRRSSRDLPISTTGYVRISD